MPRWLQVVLQGLIVAGGVAYTYKTGGPAAAVGVLTTGLAQLGIGAKAQGSNPDGTPATQPYQPPK